MLWRSGSIARGPLSSTCYAVSTADGKARVREPVAILELGLSTYCYRW